MESYKSYAVSAQRHDDKNATDYYPTPPWGTRALVEHVLNKYALNHDTTILEPACGGGHMARTLEEYSNLVYPYDLNDYGFGQTGIDFLADTRFSRYDWVITNPPFKFFTEFTLKALDIADNVAMLGRTVTLESLGRYNKIFSKRPPNKIGVFVERLPMAKGRLNKKTTTATSYSWLVWEKNSDCNSKVIWIPPCRKKFERDSDYGDTENLGGAKASLLLA